MHASAHDKLFNRTTWLLLGFIVLLSYFTYFHNYWNPPAVFWDENYHIASAQKYLHGVFFMEPHPPLGKLFIALGEKLLHPNAQSDQFINTDYATNFPKGFSFAGYRLFSALFAWWTAPLLFLIFLRIFRNSTFATLFSFFYVFENAIIVHTRGAMLEGCLIFFSVLTMLAYFMLREHHHVRGKLVLWSAVFGASFAAVMTTKLLGLLLILLIPAFLWTLRKNWKAVRTFCVAAGLGFVVVYVSVWQIHFTLGRVILSDLPDQGYYQASMGYKKILNEGTQSSLFSFPTMMRDSWHFVSHYNAGTPKLDLCKKDENGSPFYFWPIGARTINYRWETPEGKNYSYLYLQSNPVVWIGTLLGILLAFALLLGSVLQPVKEKLPHRYDLFVFFMLYAGFFAGVSRITRVLYLYHYFLALVIGFIIVAMFFQDLKQIGKFALNESKKLTALLIMAGLIFVSFQFFRPLSYYQPLTKEQFQLRNWITLWNLECIGCTNPSYLANPTKN